MCSTTFHVKGIIRILGKINTTSRKAIQSMPLIEDQRPSSSVGGSSAGSFGTGNDSDGAAKDSYRRAAGSLQAS
jgi:hypothetical protein